jgi:hypothetical protein
MRIWFLLPLIVAAGCNYAIKSAPPPTYTDLASNIALAQKHGWKVIDENGSPLFCRKQTVTGSRVRERTICMTAPQWEAFARDAERNAVEGIHGRQPCLAASCSAGG